ncbi:MAG TPA: hypothetical protein VGZ00_08710 [Candidatus Baltobacteraceae bacterium]|jgi:hypothetical protein|nr:hypothetical protein [Candidatus Baltobacteraceae bacterium]
MSDRDSSRLASDLEKLEQIKFPDQPDQPKPAVTLTLTQGEYRATLAVLGIAMIGIFGPPFLRSGTPFGDAISSVKSELSATGPTKLSDDFLCQPNILLPMLDESQLQDGVKSLGPVVSVKRLRDGQVELAYRDQNGHCKIGRYEQNMFIGDSLPARFDWVAKDERVPNATKVIKIDQMPLSAVIKKSVRV